MIAHRGYIRPTAEEQRRIEQFLSWRICMCCEQVGYRIYRERIECQHIVEARKRLGHLFTWPCCSGHHRGEWSAAQLVMIPVEQRISISDGSKLFVPLYGTQRENWERTQRRLGLPTDVWPISKILPRRVA